MVAGTVVLLYVYCTLHKICTLMHAIRPNPAAYQPTRTWPRPSRAGEVAWLLAGMGLSEPYGNVPRVSPKRKKNLHRRGRRCRVADCRDATLARAQRRPAPKFRGHLFVGRYLPSR